MVKVFDNVLSSDFLDFINREILIMQWELHHSTVEDPANFFKCTTTPYLSHQFLFEFFSKKYFSINKLIESYVNCYPPECEGTMHYDPGNFTFLFFPHSWKDEYKGRLLFENEKIDYKENRLIIFNTKLSHKAEINKAKKMRFSIAWKTVK
tara:strand:+ start:91 stop:543 length:453 start_codon:yes stop_codon:yes gene_type:complete